MKPEDPDNATIRVQDQTCVVDLVCLKSYRNPIGKDRLPGPPFFRGELLNFGGGYLII